MKNTTLSKYALFLPLVAALFLMAYACNKNDQSKPVNTGIMTKGIAKTTTNNNSADSSSMRSNEEAGTTSMEIMTSAYDNPSIANGIKRQRGDLKQLSDKNVFSVIHAKLTQQLSEKHQNYFATKADYELLYVANGEIFQERRNDNVFIVYDKRKQQVSFVIYNEKSNTYAELYRDINVENGLKDAECNFGYGTYGTLDYLLADEIVYHKKELENNPERFFEFKLCKIVNISEDKELILDRGCMSKNAPNAKNSNSICIATSTVYNNWECLNYIKATNSFILCYGQAFAD